MFHFATVCSPWFYIGVPTRGKRVCYRGAAKQAGAADRESLDPVSARSNPMSRPEWARVADAGTAHLGEECPLCRQAHGCLLAGEQNDSRWRGGSRWPWQHSPARFGQSSGFAPPPGVYPRCRSRCQPVRAAVAGEIRTPRSAGMRAKIRLLPGNPFFTISSESAMRYPDRTS